MASDQQESSAKPGVDHAVSHLYCRMVTPRRAVCHAVVPSSVPTWLSSPQSRPPRPVRLPLVGGGGLAASFYSLPSTPGTLANATALVSAAAGPTAAFIAATICFPS